VGVGYGDLEMFRMFVLPARHRVLRMGSVLSKVH
jgi:hypothetical protein